MTQQEPQHRAGPQRSSREPMRNVDKAWLDMDTPTNLMIINGVLLFDQQVEYDRLCALIEERLVTGFARFRQRLAGTSTPGGLAWEDDPYFDLRSHLRHIALPAPGDEAMLQRFMSSTISEALDPNRPLWRIYLIDGFHGDGFQGEGSAIFVRLHHAIADGVALVQVLLSLTDPAPQTAPETPPEAAAPLRGQSRARSPFGLARRLVRRSQRTLTSLASRTLHEAARTVARPRRAVELLYAAGMVSVTSAAIVAKLLLIPPDTDSVFKGTLSAHKRVAWSHPVPLETVKRIGRATGATVNDVLVAAVAGALRRYMLDHGSGRVVDIRAMVPVNLRELGTLPDALGNEFALVYLTLPLTLPTPSERLRSVKQQMDILKQSPEPLIIYDILYLIGMVPGELAEWATTWFSGKASVVLTNVPGPRTQLYFCDRPLRRIMFWVPQSGRIGLGISILSYCGEVLLGVMADEALVSEPQRILAQFEAEFGELLAAHSARVPHPAPPAVVEAPEPSAESTAEPGAGPGASPDAAAPPARAHLPGRKPPRAAPHTENGTAVPVPIIDTGRSFEAP